MRISAIIALALFAFSTPAFADYRSEYRAYMAAIEAGDTLAALQHAEAAWRAAETELGDHATTAILAYNYANFVIRVDPTKALAPYRRALEITRKGIGALDFRALELDVAVTTLETDTDDKGAAAAALAALTARGDGGADPEVMARGWIALSMYKLQSKDYIKARDYAEHGLRLAAGLDPRYPRLEAKGLIYGAIARIYDQDRTQESMTEAVSMFYRAYPLFPPQADIDHFDRLLALAMAWEGTATSLGASIGGQRWVDTGSRLPVGEDLEKGFNEARQAAAGTPQYRWMSPNPPTCVIFWEKRTPPRFPSEALNKGIVGAVIVGFDLNDTGVARSVVLSGDATLAEAGVKSMNGWRLKTPPAVACRRNYITTFSYAITG